ncbi:8768_t:CDS:2 [Ambispora gerdemannii]|uniref:8768_t:CDS:1 n=1 Tax=Ambispora gerdemannii TaxID=144530 RepID=A0A9N9F424_9GLOM|nr:8768_t:CDS:2 [Ambispora gerdemannii]
MADYKHSLTVLFTLLFFITCFTTSEPSSHELSAKIPKIANIFHKIFESIHGNKLSENAQEQNYRLSFDISVFPSCRKYNISVERLEARDWGQTFKLTIEPFAKEEESFAKIFENMFSSSKGDNDDGDNQHHNLLRRRMECEFQVLPTEDKYKLVVKRIKNIKHKYGQVFRFKLVSLDVYAKTIMYFVIPEDR